MVTRASGTIYTTAIGTVANYSIVFPDGATNFWPSYNLLVPQGIDPQAATPVVFALHGSGGRADDIVAGSFQSSGLTDSWLDRGWIVVGPESQNKAHRHWGVQAGREGTTRAWEHLLATYPNARLLVYSASMGSLMGLNWLVESARDGDSIPVEAMALNSPVTNLRDLVATNDALRPSFDDAWFADADVRWPAAQWTAAIDTPDGGHDPQQFDLSGLEQIPLRFYLGTKDKTIPPATNGTLFNQRLTALGWAAEHALVSYVGAHGGATSFQPADVNAFFDRALAL